MEINIDLKHFHKEECTFEDRILDLINLCPLVNHNKELNVFGSTELDKYYGGNRVSFTKIGNYKLIVTDGWNTTFYMDFKYCPECGIKFVLD